MCAKMFLFGPPQRALYMQMAVFLWLTLLNLSVRIVTKLIYYYQYMHSRGREYRILICA